MTCAWRYVRSSPIWSAIFRPHRQTYRRWRLDSVCLFALKRSMVPVNSEKLGGGLEVIYDPSQTVPRQRFTIAHELGHVLIERIQPGANQNAKEVERICNLIAAELLMPEEVFRQDSREPLTPTRIFGLARRYETSLIATAYRCADLAPIGIMIASEGTIQRSSGRLMESHLAKNDELLGIAERACNGERGSVQMTVTHGAQAETGQLVTSRSVVVPERCWFLTPAPPAPSHKRYRLILTPHSASIEQGSNRRPLPTCAQKRPALTEFPSRDCLAHMRVSVDSSINTPENHSSGGKFGARRPGPQTL